MNIISNNHILTKTRTRSKSGGYHYQVKDLDGIVISSRKSNRDYVAATLDGSMYFGRADLIGQGNHGNCVKYAQEKGEKLTNYLLVAKLDPNMKVTQIHESGAIFHIEDSEGQTVEIIATNYEGGESSEEARERAENKLKEIKANL